MVKIKIDYEGQLRCSAKHGPSGNSLETDAPVDNNGKGETFSPTDLVATALGTCMATVIGIVSERKELDLTGLEVEVEKHMSTDMPRRIVKLPVSINMPLHKDIKERQLIENAALTCPVHQSLRADIEIPITWIWQEEEPQK